MSANVKTRSVVLLPVFRLAVLLCVASLVFVSILPTRYSKAQDRKPDSQLEESSSAQKTNSKRRTALVIGNGNYQNVGKLPNPVNDAEDIATALKALHFDLIGGKAQLDQSADQMKRSIKEFGEVLTNGGGIGLFYYAGHGIQSAGHNYLIPVEVKGLRQKTIEFDAVDINRVLAEMDAAENGFNIVILDACRANPFPSNWRDTKQGLVQVNAPEGTLVAYATSPGRVADDGNDRNGIYTSVLLDQMPKAGIPIEVLFKNVRARVKALTKSLQVPWEASSLVGQFCFAGDCETNDSAGTTALNSNATASNVPDADTEFWNSIKNSNDPEDFRAYKKAFPDGKYVAVAENNVRRLAQSNVGNKHADSRTPANPPTPVAAVSQGPVNLSSEIYLIKDQRRRQIEIAFRAQTVQTNADSQLSAEVFNVRVDSSHVWDCTWYYWTLPNDNKLLLSWRDLSHNSAGWILVQKNAGSWWYKTNEGSWKAMEVGGCYQEFWVIGGNRVSIGVTVPYRTNGWTTDDVEYSFGS
jgi:Caspase domain